MIFSFFSFESLRLIFEPFLLLEVDDFFLSLMMIIEPPCVGDGVEDGEGLWCRRSTGGDVDWGGDEDDRWIGVWAEMERECKGVTLFEI